MKQFQLIITTMLFMAGLTNYSHAKSEWIDITEERLVNPGFDGNSNKGWTFVSNAGSQAVRCESMEFWNGTFDIYQTISSLPAGHYRMSVQSYYRCQDNNNGYPKYTAGTEDITAYMYAGNTKQKLKSIYSFYFTEVPMDGTWSTWINGQMVFFPNTMETATKALELLMEENPKKAEALAAQLCSLNDERKEMTQEGVDKAIEQYEKLGMDKDTVVVLYLPQVHESIAGIIAGRVREYCHKPVFILTRSTDAVKGSGRSIEEYSMYEEMCRVKDLFIKFGGHPMAAGLSLPEEKVDEFRRRINENSPLTEKDLVEKVKIDVPMPVSYVTKELVREFEILAPFGKGNPRPVFADRNLYISRMWCVGKNQNVLRLSLVSSDGRPISAIYFGNIELFMDYLREKYSSEDVELALR